MRMRVLFGRAAVRGPARVAEAVEAGERLRLDGVFEIDQLAGAAPDFDRAVLDDGDAGRVVAAIFEPPQPLEEDGHDGLRSDVTDDSAHIVESLSPSGRLVFRFATQPVLVFLPCRGRWRARRPARPSVTAEPAAMYEPSAKVTGATSVLLLPTNDALADLGLVLLLAVVVAGDGAGADVGFRADRRIAEIRQVIRLRALAHRGLLELDEVADVRILADARIPAGCARTGRRTRRASTVESVTTVWFLTHTRSPIGRVDDPRAGVDFAGGSDLGRAFEKDARDGSPCRRRRRRRRRRRWWRDRSSVTPAAINSSFFCWRTMVLTSASSVRLLMPRISSARSTVQVATARFCLR